MHVLRYFLILARFLPVYGGGCGAETGSNNFPGNLGANETTITNTGLAVRLIDAQYTTTCACGIITQWSFYTRRNGTVIFYALDGSTVRGKTSITIPELSHDNYYEIPLSSEMWISVRSGYTLGFLTPDLPMITYGTDNYQYYRSTGQSEVAVGSAGTFSTFRNNIEYAVRATIETGHAPMFTNLPHTVSIYTHEAGIPIITVSATDIDPDDRDNLVMTATYDTTYFDFLPPNMFMYKAIHTASTTLTLTVTVSDGCLQSTELLTVELINEPPTFTNLPGAVEINEKGSGSSNIFTIVTSDLAAETVRCYLDTTDTTITNWFSVGATSKAVTVTYPGTNGGFVHDSRPAYNLPIRCEDADNRIYSILVVDLIKNEPPVYSGATGFLPASQVVGRNSNPLYTLAASDNEGDTLTYSINNCSSTSCPITVGSTSGIVTYTSILSEAYYDIIIDVSDSFSTTTDTLTLLVSDDLDFNNRPLFRNLPATIYVTENTPANTALFKFLYYEQDTWDSLTFTTNAVSDGSANTYFQMDPATQIVSVKAPFDYDTVTPTTVYIDYRVQDPAGDSDTQRLTIIYQNMNEAPTISITTTTITVDEGVRNAQFTDPGLGVSDPDSGDAANCKWSLDCGADSKYFYINDGDRRIYLAREYDMDAGLVGNATCVVAVIDPDGLSSTATVTLSINNINDNVPKFPYQRYLFLQNPDDPFFQKVADLTATDADSNAFGSTLGTITYSFDTTNYPASTTYYQMDVNGVLYVRDVSSFSRGDSYVFKVFAVDSGSLTGTATISILFAEVETVTTTTTQRTFTIEEDFETVTTTTTQRTFTFEEDFGNYVWLFIVAILLAFTMAVVAFIVETVTTTTTQRTFTFEEDFGNYVRLFIVAILLACVMAIVALMVETVTTTTTQRTFTFEEDFGNYVWLFIVAILLACVMAVLAFMVETVTTTTTQRTFTFEEDFGNYVWLFIVAILLACVMAIVAFMVWFDPVVHNFVAFKLMRIDECCRHKPKEPKRTVGKLTLTINNKTLENDPDNALPWELAAKDANVPEMNQVQEEISRRKEKKEMDYMKLTGRNIFEKGKGVRPATAEIEVHSAQNDGRSSESPRYDAFETGSSAQINDGFDDGGPSNWERPRSMTSYLHVTPLPEDEQETNVDDVNDHSQPLTTYNYNGNGQPSHMDF